jgi:hypothetical protein
MAKGPELKVKVLSSEKMVAYLRVNSKLEATLVAKVSSVKKKDNGTETLSDGTVSRGMWYNDMKHGQFVTITPQHEWTKEYWSNGRLDKAESSYGTKNLR